MCDALHPTKSTVFGVLGRWCQGPIGSRKRELGLWSLDYHVSFMQSSSTLTSFAFLYGGFIWNTLLIKIIHYTQAPKQT
jgi:hypothetical protein